MKYRNLNIRAPAMLLLVTAATLSACASAPIPTDQISLAKDAVNRAVSAGATEYAPLQMKTAQDKVFVMERDMGEKNYVKVKALAEQIQADASLAERTATTVKTQKALADAKSGIQVLKQEMLQAPASVPTPTR
ncbi:MULTISPECIES: DUF4398 domain-containing protein [unclassified Pseudomonas]|uniref:DUF4398 domain-containing protein n=1 Tax=unclassified Pseudomonas TaxID=196821 RepID=UPI0015A18C8F|nr:MULTISPECIES: DUF4398 domain-containing protein [unclassified Pseudomonas]NWC94845.1 DUF4398 domain-containing protein [Pseudomonas sp. IPO3779]NWD15917.1 DUF4398 domain-containing protein [Pseudomonas sp. IPO3778]